MRNKVDLDKLRRDAKAELDKARAIMDAVRDEEGRALTAEEQTKWDQHMEEARRIGDDIAREEILRAAEQRYEGLPQPVMKPEPTDDPARIGMTAADIKGFSLFRAVRAAMSGDWRQAPLEREASEAVAKRLGRSARANGFFVPYEVQIGRAEKRDITITTEGTDIMAPDFGSLIDLLRNRSLVRQAGARFLTGLRGDLQFPKLTGAATGYWVAEGGAPTESTQTFGQVKLSPKQLAAFTDITRQTLLQSSFDVEQAIRDDLTQVLAIALDLAALHGTGAANQPTGIINQTGVGVVAIGVNGGAPTWANILALEETVAISNADIGSLAYLTNPKVRRKLKSTERSTGSGIYLWNDIAPYGSPQTPLNGYAALVTNQVASNLTKGTGTNLSAVFFGNWAECLVGIWSDFEVIVDPYTASTTGIVRLVALVNADIGVRHGESFAVIKDADTT